MELSVLIVPRRRLEVGRQGESSKGYTGGPILCYFCRYTWHHGICCDFIRIAECYNWRNALAQEVMLHPQHVESGPLYGDEIPTVVWPAKETGDTPRRGTPTEKAPFLAISTTSGVTKLPTKSKTS